MRNAFYLKGVSYSNVCNNYINMHSASKVTIKVIKG